MGKKNTLLYLDEDLVKLAKRHNLNLSHLAEAAIRSQLLPVLSVQEKQLDFHQHLNDLKEQGDCYELPLLIEKVRLRNVGPFDKLELDFVKGVNLILGPNGSGKSVLVRTLANAFRLYGFSGPNSFLNYDRSSGEIVIKFFSNEITIKYIRSKGGTVIPTNKRCILLDSPVNLVSPNNKQRFVEWIKEKFDQAIMVSAHEDFRRSSVDKLSYLPTPTYNPS